MSWLKNLAWIFLLTTKCLADIGLVSQDGEKTWVLYLSDDGKQTILSECLPPSATPQRDCHQAPGSPNTVPVGEFKSYLSSRLRVSNLVNANQRLDYLNSQTNRLQNKLADPALPLDEAKSLTTTLNKLESEKAIQNQIITQQMKDRGKNFTLYQRVISGLSFTSTNSAPWIIDGAESLGDYGITSVGLDRQLLISFLFQVYQGAPEYPTGANAVAAATLALPINFNDFHFDSIDAAVASRFDSGAFALTGHSNQYSRPEQNFESQLTYYRGDGVRLWEDVSNDFRASSDSHSVVELGKQSFIIVGSLPNGQQSGAIRLITVTSGYLKAQTYYYPTLPRFRTITQMKDGNLLISALGKKTFWAVRLAPTGKLLSSLELTPSLGTQSVFENSNGGALITGQGANIFYADTEQTPATYLHCLKVMSVNSDLTQILWTQEECDEHSQIQPSSATATTNGGFVIGGRIERFIAESEQKNGWDWKRHRAFLFGFDASGAKTFDYRSAEYSGYPWAGYEALGFDQRNGELIAVGSEPSHGIVDIFDSAGEFLVHAKVGEHENTNLHALTLLPNQPGFSVGGTGGDRGPWDGLHYNALGATMLRK